MSHSDFGFNPWGIGLGLDGGYTLPSAVYVGGTFDYFFGDSMKGTGSKLTGNVWQLMAEGGYDIGVGRKMVIRPKLGAGVGTTREEACLDGFGCSSDSATKFALAPGVKFMVILPSVGLSFDLRYAMIFTNQATVDPGGNGPRSDYGNTATALIFSVGVGF